MSVRPVRVALCDGDSLALRALTCFLASSGEVQLVGTARRGVDAVTLVEKSEPDVLVLDAQVPDLDARQVAGAVRRLHTRCRVLYLTACPRPSLGDDVLSGVAAGALRKDLDRDTFLRAVQSIADGLTLLEQGTIPTPCTMAGAIPDAPPTDGMVVAATMPACGEGIARTPAERQVLHLLCQGAQNAEIARRLNFSESWVKATLRSLMRRTGANNRVELVLAAIGRAPVLQR